MVAADLPSAKPPRFRRALTRGVRGRPYAFQHPAAGFGAAERPDICRGRARLRRADLEKRGRDLRRPATLGLLAGAVAGAPGGGGAGPVGPFSKTSCGISVEA